MPTIMWILIMTETVLRGLVDWIPRLLLQILQSSFPHTWSDVADEHDDHGHEEDDADDDEHHVDGL